MPRWLSDLDKVRINMWCPTCASHQTFGMQNEFDELCPDDLAPEVAGSHFRLLYQCTHCQEFERVFFVVADREGAWYRKVGQYPAWETKTDPEVERLLGQDHAGLYHKALVCESCSYGIAAFAYYRRIVEQVIDGLLDEIAGLMDGSELEKYKLALEATKKTIVAQDKIDLVKDLLPPILRPGRVNPLQVLHSVLSEGLHARTDEECLEDAALVRGALVFLVDQVAASAEASKSFTAGMRKLLDKRARRHD